MAATQILSGQGASSDDVSLSPPTPPPAPAPLTIPLQCNSSAGGALVDEEPDSPTSPPGSWISPQGYTPLLTRTFSFGEYGPPPPPVNRELCYNNAKSSCTATSPAMDESIQPIQDDLEYDMYPPPPDYSVEPWFAVRQATEFAETALQCHNNDPSNEVKYELVKAIVSNYMFEGSQNFGHVNFTATATQQDDSEEQLFFAELNLRDVTTLTCFCSLKEKEDQAGGCIDIDTEAKGVVDPEHCYACGDELKHPRDGASYQGGHGTERQR